MIQEDYGLAYHSTLRETSEIIERSESRVHLLGHRMVSDRCAVNRRPLGNEHGECPKTPVLSAHHQRPAS